MSSTIVDILGHPIHQHALLSSMELVSSVHFGWDGLRASIDALL